MSFTHSTNENIIKTVFFLDNKNSIQIITVLSKYIVFSFKKILQNRTHTFVHTRNRINKKCIKSWKHEGEIHTYQILLLKPNISLSRPLWSQFDVIKMLQNHYDVNVMSLWCYNINMMSFRCHYDVNKNIIGCRNST